MTDLVELLKAVAGFNLMMYLIKSPVWIEQQKTTFNKYLSRTMLYPTPIDFSKLLVDYYNGIKLEQNLENNGYSREDTNKEIDKYWDSKSRFKFLDKENDK